MMGKSERMRALVQIVRDGGENNLHYHTNSDTTWVVMKGRVRFYGLGDRLIGEYGPRGDPDPRRRALLVREVRARDARDPAGRRLRARREGRAHQPRSAQGLDEGRRAADRVRVTFGRSI
jgi:hypothetical protein